MPLLALIAQGMGSFLAGELPLICYRAGSRPRAQDARFGAEFVEEPGETVGTFNSGDINSGRSIHGHAFERRPHLDQRLRKFDVLLLERPSS